MSAFTYMYTHKYYLKWVLCMLASCVVLGIIYALLEDLYHSYAVVPSWASIMPLALLVYSVTKCAVHSLRTKRRTLNIQATALSSKVYTYEVASCKLYVAYNGTAYNIGHLYTERTELGLPMKAPVVIKGTTLDTDCDPKGTDFVLADSHTSCCAVNTFKSYFEIKLRAVDDANAEDITHTQDYDMPLYHHIGAVFYKNKPYLEQLDGDYTVWRS